MASQGSPVSGPSHEIHQSLRQHSMALVLQTLVAGRFGEWLQISVAEMQTVTDCVWHGCPS